MKVYQVEEDKSQVQQLCEAVAAVTAQVEKLQQDMKQSRQYQGSNYQRPRRGRFVLDSREQGRSCWHCGERGHFRRDCPHLKAQNLSSRSAQMPEDYTLPHLLSRQPVCTCTNSNNLSFQVTVLINGLPVHCLIDSGATISLIKHDLLHNNEWLGLIRQSCVLAKGANGMPLETKGQVELPCN